MEKDNPNNQKNIISSVEKPKITILMKLFSAFIFFSIFTIIALSLIAFWTFQSTHLDLTTEELTILYTNYKNNFIFVILLVIVPAIFLAVSVAEHIASPVRLIKNSIKEIAQGNLDIKLSTDRRDEFANVINLFNEMAAKLKEVKERNDEISKMKSNFITVASHQLRTPVSGVRWGLDALASELKGPLNQDQKDILAKCIERNTETIKNIDDLLKVSQIEENNFPYELKEVYIKELLEKAIKEFDAEVKIKNKKISYQNKLEKDIKLIADPARINTVFNNLIENAINYGTNDTDILISISIEGEYVLIQVENYGIGIKKEDEEKIFAKFFRAENAILSKPNGIGLGLYITKKIIEYHKGKIIAFSREDEGKTVFSVYLPIPKSLITEKAPVENFLESI
ncbi:MAG: HAMP domain-containing histidine kinase [Candidatus Pacebacteria bacterium]|nr:HAMP domain-containing histidine kinase [Candidatus Paceibacterota bacterium]